MGRIEKWLSTIVKEISQISTLKQYAPWKIHKHAYKIELTVFINKLTQTFETLLQLFDKIFTDFEKKLYK